MKADLGSVLLNHWWHWAPVLWITKQKMRRMEIACSPTHTLSISISLSLAAWPVHWSDISVNKSGLASAWQRMALNLHANCAMCVGWLFWAGSMQRTSGLHPIIWNIPPKETCLPRGLIAWVCVEKIMYRQNMYMACHQNKQKADCKKLHSMKSYKHIMTI